MGPKNRKTEKQRRKPRVHASSLGRIKPYREPKETALIVCEDSKSSYYYFIKLRQKFHLGTIDVEVCGPECGSAPISVVDYAKKEKEKALSTRTNNDGYDYIFCVIDKDIHRTLDRAIDKAKGNDLTIVLSNPCFEYWYILHFNLTGSSYNHHRDVVKHLKKDHYPKYDKGCDEVFDTVYPLTDTAIRNSKQILKTQHHNEEDLRKCNPSTHVHRVVERMQEISKQ